MTLLSSDEVQELLALSRGETFTYDTTKTWIDLFKEQVALHPDRPAVVDAEGTYTYHELDEASDAVARYLIAKGLQPHVHCHTHGPLAPVHGSGIGCAQGIRGLCAHRPGLSRRTRGIYNGGQ